MQLDEYKGAGEYGDGHPVGTMTAKITFDEARMLERVFELEPSNTDKNSLSEIHAMGASGEDHSVDFDHGDKNFLTVSSNGDGTYKLMASPKVAKKLQLLMRHEEWLNGQSPKSAHSAPIETSHDMDIALLGARLRYVTGVESEVARGWLEKWMEPHRFYHDMEHLFQMRRDLGNCFLRNDVLLATVFHDIIYDPRRNDNEEKSRDFFLKQMPTAFQEANSELMDAVAIAIMETKHSEAPQSELGKLICAADLKPLVEGDLETLIRNENRLFKEYQVYPYDSYKAGRLQFLGKWVERNPTIAKLMEYVQHRPVKIGIYAGSFDPFTIGHQNILKKAERIFDKVIIARGLNPAKSEWAYKLPPCLEYHEKIYVGKESVHQNMQVRVIAGECYDMDCAPNLAVVMMEHPDATLVRGLRGAADLEAEKLQQIYVEKMMGDKSLNAVYITCDREFDHISSSAFKQLVKVDKAQAALCCPNGMPQ